MTARTNIAVSPCKWEVQDRTKLEQNIMLTCPYNVDPLKPNIYKVIFWFTIKYDFFLVLV